ncbi:glycosyltransferase family protein [Microbacterium paraoxydans]|uniref:glycosyltransferase family protein n=1 Tax=Microbacterium paraoxydans TaxID=199592 RepID=UPI001CFBBD93|nr:glycosyltransferase [Microbacterium paraoxydans]
MPAADRPTMIFHVPFPLNPEATSASGIRPVMMRRAFEEAGYDVIEISGHHPQRRAKIREVKRRIAAGLAVDFVYSEAATTPTGLGEPVTWQTSLTRDIAFLRFCRRNGVPVGLFYRDIYWRDEEYAQRVGQPYTTLLRWRYRADLKGYRTAVDRLFVPSMRMAEVMPFTDPTRCTALPPGCVIVETSPVDDPATMFYVGSVGHYYQLQEAVRAFESVEGSSFILCTNAAQWETEKSSYEPLFSSGATKVVHATGSDLEPFYDVSALGCLFMAPIGYREFAAPLKLYEYLGHGRPIIATAGSLAADFVEQNGIGWALPYDGKALADLVEELRREPQSYREVAERASSIRHEHTWVARAAQVATELTGQER